MSRFVSVWLAVMMTCIVGMMVCVAWCFQMPTLGHYDTLPAFTAAMSLLWILAIGFFVSIYQLGTKPQHF